ncbi:MAG: phosphotransferase, partial [bacterium]
MYLDHRTGPEPVLADALGWLRSHVPEGTETVLVHGDYRTGNLVFRDDAIVAILDWEFAQPGDPMRDVAWVLAGSNRVGSELACYLIDPERFARRYEEVSGRSIDWAAVRFWQLSYQVFNALCWTHAEHALRAGRTRDLRMLRWSYTMPVMRSLVVEALRAVV